MAPIQREVFPGPRLCVRTGVARPNVLNWYTELVTKGPDNRHRSIRSTVHRRQAQRAPLRPSGCRHATQMREAIRRKTLQQPTRAPLQGASGRQFSRGHVGLLLQSVRSDLDLCVGACGRQLPQGHVALLLQSVRISPDLWVGLRVEVILQYMGNCRS